MLRSSSLNVCIDSLQGALKQIPVRMESALDSGQWIGRMRGWAADALEDADGFTDDEKAMLPILVDAIIGESSAAMMQFSIGPISRVDMPTPALDSAGNPNWNADPDKPSMVVDLEMFEKIEDWIAAGKKELKGRDFNADGSQKSTTEIATRVARAIEDGRAQSFFRTDEIGKGALEVGGLAQYEGIIGMAEDCLSRALLIVLEKWAEELAANVPQEVAQRIGNAFD